MTPRRLSLPFLLTLLTISAIAQDDKPWDILTHQEVGVDRFAAKYPDFDGKGVVIAVLDTGVDMGVEGLKKLPTGGVKVVDVRDFSTEGDLAWEEGRIVPDGKGEKIVDSKGRALRDFRKAVAGARPERFYLAWIEEAAFADADVKDLNGDGDVKDRFGILVFTTYEGEDGGQAKPAEGQTTPARDLGPRYMAVVDLNGDGKLDDGVRFTDYWRKHETFVLAGKKGDRRQLTFAANFYPEEGRLSLHYDAGGHGTHVAGIAAGYRINGQDGYDGMAPGARVISLKIGNNRYAGGSTVTESIKKALDYGVHYAKTHKVPVVYNMSFGIGSELESKSAIDQYVDGLLEKNPGVVFVTSAGNEGPGLSTVGTPAAALGAISVGALLSPAAARAQYGAPLPEEVLFSFSSRGGELFKPDILAPGSASSTVPPWETRDHYHGTSMASPAAAGTIARLVDGLARHEKKGYRIDNALVFRAVKNTARHVSGMTVLDEGGGVLDLPAAFEYAKFLYQSGEDKRLRGYRIVNRGMAAGVGAYYWRYSPALPRKTDVTEFVVRPVFPAGATAEAKARFYRAFALETDADWISLTKPMIYIKGSASASFGVMVDVTGLKPGLHTGRVRAVRRGDDRVGGRPVHEFDVPVTVIVPHRTTPENRGSFQVSGTVPAGRVDRVFVEVPPGISAIHLSLRMLDGDKASYLSAPLFDPAGVARGNAGVVSELSGRTEASRTIAGPHVVPGTWEVVVSSFRRSQTPARYDLGIRLLGVEFGDPVFFEAPDGPTRDRLLVPLRCTQAGSFNGTVKARLGKFVRREVMDVKDTDTFERTIRLDDATKTLKWTIEFDRETFALFTDCVLQVVDATSGKTLRNTALGYRSESVSVAVSAKGGAVKEFKLVLKPGFSLAKDEKHWHFILTEELNWNAAALELEPVSPARGRLLLHPNDWQDLIFRLPAMLPAPPEGYRIGGELEATPTHPEGVRITVPLRLP